MASQTSDHWSIEQVHAEAVELSDEDVDFATADPLGDGDALSSEAVRPQEPVGCPCPRA